MVLQQPELVHACTILCAYLQMHVCANAGWPASLGDLLVFTCLFPGLQGWAATLGSSIRILGSQTQVGPHARRAITSPTDFD